MKDEIKEFVLDTALRCGYTFAEVMLGFITVGAALKDIPWRIAISVALVAVLACVFKQFIIFARQHMNPKFSNEDMIAMSVEEPEYSADDKPFTESELSAYRERMSGGDEDDV